MWVFCFYFFFRRFCCLCLSVRGLGGFDDHFAIRVARSAERENSLGKFAAKIADADDVTRALMILSRGEVCVCVCVGDTF